MYGGACKSMRQKGEKNLKPGWHSLVDWGSPDRRRQEGTAGHCTVGDIGHSVVDRVGRCTVCRIGRYTAGRVGRLDMGCTGHYTAVGCKPAVSDRCLRTASQGSPPVAEGIG